MIAVVLEFALNILTALTFGRILVIAITVTALSYLIGDLLILSHSNNTVSTIVDMVLALAVIYLFNYGYNYKPISFTDALICSLLIGAGEWFFHKYMVNSVFPERNKVNLR